MREDGSRIFDPGPVIALLRLSYQEPGRLLKRVSREKFKMLAEERGWSLRHAEGFVDGESFRRRGKRPPTYVLVCLDEYSQGFRAGYFERKFAASDRNPAKARL